MAITNVKQLSELASTSLAAYAYFTGASDSDLFSMLATEGKDNGVGMTDVQATHFRDQFRLLAIMPNDFFADPTGFNATLFQDKETGKKILALRGTEFDKIFQILPDGAIADALGIAGAGFANFQAIQLYRYVKQLTTDGGQTVQYSDDDIAKIAMMFFAKQIELATVILPQGTAHDIAVWASQQAGFSSLFTDLANDKGIGTGAALLQPGEKVDVTGHSLGGHLALLFARMFPQYTDQVVTLNAPTFFATGDAFLTSIGFPPGSGSNITRLEADGDAVHLIGNVDPGYAISIAQEEFPDAINKVVGNHSSVNGVDGLNLMALIVELDPSLINSPMQISGFIRNASNDFKDTYEKILDALRHMILGNSITETEVSSGSSDAKRTSFYDNMDVLKNSATFQSLIGNVTLAAPATSASEARDDFGAFLSLMYLTPFALKITDAAAESALAAVQGTLYDQWNDDGALTAEQKANGEANFSDMYLADRAAMLSWKNKLNKEDFVDHTGLGYTKDTGTLSYHFEDITANLSIDINKLSNKKRYIVFGEDIGPINADTLTGGDKSDHLYGMGGNDEVNGHDGNDWLEGNAGDDTLKGGLGNDLMFGGDGSDTYVINQGEGYDTIIDSDGAGKVVIGTFEVKGKNSVIDLKNWKQISPNSWVDSENNITYSRIQNISNFDLLVRKDNAYVLIKNWLAGNLSIEIGSGAEATAAETNMIILGDLKPKDQSPEEGIQYGYDELRNVIVTVEAEPDRKDILYGSSGNDLIKGFGGGDILLGGAGEDRDEGGSGNDFLMTGADNDVLLGGSDSDIALGQEGDDHVFGETEFTIEDAYALGENQIGTNQKGDLLDGGSDNDVVIGFAGNDILFGGLGKDVLMGLGGDDVIEGDNSINEISAVSDWGVTKTVTGNTYTRNYTEFNSVDSLNNNAFESTGLGDDDAIYGGAGADWIFAGGGNDFADGGTGSDVIFGWAGNDMIFGQDGNDVLSGDSGQLTLNGSLHGDDYINGGSGNDVLYGNGGSDYLEGGDGDDELVGDGADIPIAYQKDDVLIGGAGSDKLYGAGGNDILDGGAGADELYGGAGDDTYRNVQTDDIVSDIEGKNTIIFNKAYGIKANSNVSVASTSDSTLSFTLDDDSTVKLQAALYGMDATLEFADGQGIDLEAFISTNLTNSVTLNLASIALPSGANPNKAYGGAGADQVFGSSTNDTIKGYGGNDRLQSGLGDDIIYGGDGIDTILGEGGDDQIYGDAGDDELQGNSGNDNISGGSGNDTIFGQDGADTLEGGLGQDTLVGGFGDDVYVFNLGDGHDIIYEETDTLGDVFKFGVGINASDIVLSSSGPDLIMSHNNGQDKITIANWYVDATYQLKEIQFADGQIWTGAQVTYLGSLRGSENDDYISGTSQNETLYGMGGDDVLISNGGVDTLIGGQGNDYLYGGYSFADTSTYLFSLGDGQDHIQIRNSYKDILRFSPDIQSSDVFLNRVDSDLVLSHQNETDTVTLVNWYTTAAKLAKVEFSDGTFLGTDTLSSMGMNVDNTYVFNVGIGQKVINDWGGTDTLNIANGILDSEIIISRIGQDLQLAHINGVDKIRFREWFNDVSTQIESILFADSGTLLTKAQITNQHINITGTSGSDILNGGNAYGETILGLAGNDTIYGGGGNDLITGGLGNDTLYGGAGSNTYYFNIGDGQDYINPDYQTGTTIVFGAGLYELFNSSYVYGQDTVFSFNNSTDKVTVKAYSPIDIRFIRNLTAQSDNFTGSQYGEYIYGLAGNDTIAGGKGGDWLFGGDGDDILDGYIFTDLEYVNDSSTSDKPDSFTGGKGNDTLNGSSNNDTYYFNLGDGNDTIIEASYNMSGQSYYSTNDRIIFGYGITTSNIQLSKFNSDLLIRVSPTDTISVRNWFSDGRLVIETLDFSDGSNLNSSTITKNIFTQIGTSGNDVLTGDTSFNNFLYGENGNDTLTGGNQSDELDGGNGNDILNGGYGNDFYYFKRGMGDDQITDASGTDTVYFDATISSADVSLSRNQNDLVITINNNGGSITLKNYLVDQYSIVENFIFSDGSSLPSYQVIVDSLLTTRGTNSDDTLSGTNYVDLIYGEDGNDILNGFEDNDRLFGGAGNDYLDGGIGYDQLNGGDGNDVYFYSKGYEDDTITDTGGDDSLMFASNVSITDLKFRKSSSSLDIDVDTSYVGITLYNHYTNATNQLERLIFSDGRTLGLSDIQMQGGLVGTAADSILIGYNDFADYGENSTLNGGGGNDYLAGGAGADTLYGGEGNDWLNGGSGSFADVMVGNSGDDFYYVDYRNDTVTEQLNEGIDTVHSTLAYTLGNNVENLTLTGTASVNGTGNALDNIFRGNSAANTFTGGAGNDTYYLSTGDSAVEGRTSSGIDVVCTDVTYTLGTNIENGNIIGTAEVNLTGNILNNIMTGNAAANILNGGAGVDTLTGGLGDDTYIIDVATDVVLENANEGNDTIQVGYATTAATTLTTGVGQFTNIENITVTGTGQYNLTGDAANNTLIGNASANVLTGNAGNDVLNGLAGNDNMSGGFGNDTYTVDVAGDVVTENLNEGTDLVNVAITTKSGTYTLGNNIENGTLINAVTFTLTGNALDNILNGNGVANTLNGGDGNDVLDGRAGIDNMSGGLGNDTYFVDVTGDVVTEAVGAGTDSVNVGIATASGTYTLGTNLEIGKLTNTVAFNLTGNILNNYLIGNIANNVLTDAAGGNDILQGLAGIDTFTDTVGNNLFDGGVGNDLMTAGSGGDLFIGGLGVDTITSGTGYDVIAFNKGDGQDTVNASTGADNTLSLGGNFAYSDLSLTKSTNDLILIMGTTEQITLKDWYIGTTNKSVVNLQVIAEAMQGFILGSADDLRNNKIENFNFAGIVSQFDAAGATANWQLTDARLTAHLQAGSDSAAIGGDLAYQYGKDSGLTGMGLSNAQSVIAAASFGQTAQTLNNPSVWQAEVVKLG